MASLELGASGDALGPGTAICVHACFNSWGVLGGPEVVCIKYFDGRCDKQFKKNNCSICEFKP